MNTELIAVIRHKVSFDKFCKRYFDADKKDGKYINKSGEILSMPIANDFYEEYVNSQYSLKRYIALTQKDIS